MQIHFTKWSPSTELLLIVCVSAFMDSLGYGIIIPFLPQYALSSGASDFDLGIIFASYALVQLVTTIPFGLMSDRYGRKPFMVTGMLLLGVASLLYPLAQTVPMMILCRAIQGLAASATWSSAIAVVADTFPGRDKGEKLGIAAGVTSMGGIAGPLAGGFLSEVNFNLPFLIIGTVCIAIFIYMIFRLKETNGKPTKDISYTRMIRNALGVRNVLIIIIINVLTAIFWGFLEPLTPPYLSGRYSLSSTEIGIVFGAMSLFYALLQPIVGRLSDKYGRKKFVIIGIAIHALGNLLILFCRDALSLSVCLVFAAAIGAVAWTPLTPLVIESLQDDGVEAYATVQSLFSLAAYTGYSIGPVIGILISSYSGFETMFIFYSLILVILLIFSKIYIKETIKKEIKRETMPPVELKIPLRRRILSHKKLFTDDD